MAGGKTSAPGRSRIPFRRKMDLLVVLPALALTALLVPVTYQEVRSAQGWTDAANYLSSTKQVSTLVQDLSLERVQAQAALFGSPGTADLYLQSIKTTDAQVSAILAALQGRGSPQLMSALNSIADLSYVRGQAQGIASAQDPAVRYAAQNLVNLDYGKIVTGLVQALDVGAGGANQGNPAASLETQLAALYQGDLAENQREASLAAFAGTEDGTTALEEFTTAVQMSQVAADELGFVLTFPELGDGGRIRSLLYDARAGWFTDYQQRIAAALLPDFAGDPAAGSSHQVAEDLKQLKTASYREFSTVYFEGLSRDRASAEAAVTDSIIKRAHDSARRARLIAGGLIGGAVLILLLLIVLSAVIRRSVVRPVLQLTQAASRVARAAAADLERVTDEDAGQHTALPEFTPLPVAGDEIGDLARAFNQVQETALLVLERQVTIRRNTAEMFGNVGRRIHNLTGRQLAIIDQVERSETDPVLLDRMYRIDHLAVRLQRGADSLILLSGERESNISGAPMRLTDVVRSAVGRVEGYQRAVLIAEDDAMVAPAAVSDLTLMIAELVENAVSFSPASSRVEIAVGLTQRGFVVEIVDRGMGMTPDHLAAENARLVRRERLDLAPTRVLGLFVVGRLSVRTGAAVELAPTPGGGTTARIFVPGFLLAGPSTEPLPQRTPQSEIVAAQGRMAPDGDVDGAAGGNGMVNGSPVSSGFEGVPGYAGVPMAPSFGLADMQPPPRPTDILGDESADSDLFGAPLVGGGRRRARAAVGGDAQIPRQSGPDGRSEAAAELRGDEWGEGRVENRAGASAETRSEPWSEPRIESRGEVHGEPRSEPRSDTEGLPQRRPRHDTAALGVQAAFAESFGAPAAHLPGPVPQEAHPVYAEAPEDPPTMITSPLPPLGAPSAPSAPPVPPAIVPQPADGSLPRRVRGSAPVPVWPPAGTLTAALEPPPQQDAVAVREALEGYEAGVEKALRDSAGDLPTRRRSGPRHAGAGTAGVGEDAVPPEDTRRTTP